MLGRPCWPLPEWMKKLALVCSEKFDTIERITARSSTQVATCGKRSLTGMPLAPYCRNFQGDCSTAPTLLNCVGGTFILMGCPCSFARRGLGSKESSCEGPPSMNRKITLRALVLNCGG